MKSNRIIGVDLDDVLLNFNDPLAIYHNNKYGTSYERKDIKSYNLRDVFKCDDLEVNKRVLDFYLSNEHLKAVPTNGAIEAVKILSKNHILYIVTSKPESIREQTQKWLDKYFPKMFKGIYFTNHFIDGIRRDKIDVCKELGIELFIEDALIHADNISSAGIPVLLIDNPWNQREIKEPIKRVYSWKEIVDLIA